MQVKQLIDWAKANPIVAVVYGTGVLFVVVLMIVIVSALAKSSGPTQKDLSALEQEPNMAKRVRKLADIEGTNSGKPSARYTEAMQSLYEALTHSEALPEDLVAFGRVAVEAGEIDNHDFAWWVVIETRLQRGVWPKWPDSPPQDLRVAQALRETLARNSRIDVELPKDLALRDKWLRFVVGGQASGPLLAEFYKEKDTQDNHLLLYQQLAAIGAPAAWLAEKLYSQLALLPEPLFVLDTDASIQAPQVARGPENTLLFLGVLEGERCAIAMEKKPLPLLWVRSCKGLEPRRLAHGELFLLGVDNKYDSTASMRWLPALREDNGRIAVGHALRGRVDDRVLASFIVAAPRFVHDGRSFKPFSPALELVTATAGGEKLASFQTTSSGKAGPALLAFAPSAKAKAATICPHIDKDRCAPLIAGSEEDKCEIGPALCADLGNGAVVRWAKTTVIHPVPCMKEYGRKADCKHGVTVGIFVDVKTGGDFIPALHATVQHKDAD